MPTRNRMALGRAFSVLGPESGAQVGIARAFVRAVLEEVRRCTVDVEQPIDLYVNVAEQPGVPVKVCEVALIEDAPSDGFRVIPQVHGSSGHPYTGTPFPEGVTTISCRKPEDVLCEITRCHSGVPLDAVVVFPGGSPSQVLWAIELMLRYRTCAGISTPRGGVLLVDLPSARSSRRLLLDTSLFRQAPTSAPDRAPDYLAIAETMERAVERFCSFLRLPAPPDAT